MAVEARHLNPFPSQILSNREMMLNGLESMNNTYTTGMMYGHSTVAPITGAASTAAGIMAPDCMMRADDSSLITHAHHHPQVLSRKRSREDISNSIINMNQFVTCPSDLCGGDNRSAAGQFTFLGEDFSPQIQGQQFEVESLLAHHTEKLRLEIVERRKNYSRRIMAAVEQGITNKLKAKEDEFQKIMRFNYALEEQVKSLCVDIQIWRDLAQTNVATANILRTNLEQVLAQLENNPKGVAEQLEDDAQSCCGSNDVQEPERQYDATGNGHDQGGIRLCRDCGKEEACVLLLPCRHLCLCSVCGSSQNICPVCKCAKNCSFHVNISS
ncbi:hypothetical protein LIER_35471 [Lithospermum erythrorhizon]|uniref:RING-type domain-containing protein n=1 Tax=Lithospermum erythrorhizon TaxID=34254 RepID=A0AAV3NR94_LITER